MTVSSVIFDNQHDEVKECVRVFESQDFKVIAEPVTTIFQTPQMELTCPRNLQNGKIHRWTERYTDLLSIKQCRV